MFKVNKNLFYTILLLVCICSFSGCILKDLAFGTNFSLISWDICDNEGFPCLSIIFSSTGTISIKILSPDGEIIDTDLLYHGDDNTLLNIAPFRGTVIEDKHKLIVHDENNNVIFEKIFLFNGSDLIINSCSQKWWKEKTWTDDYSLIGLTLSVYNNGDTPVYPYSVDVNMDSKNYSGIILPSIISPGEHKVIHCYIYKKTLPTDSFLTIYLKDSNKNIISNNSFSIVLEDNVPTKEFEWKYKWRNRKLSIPFPDFLYTYFNSKDRIHNEDYSAYIFDLYDDYFINLVVDRLMHDLIMDNEVDKINYAASFVQNLEYKKDSVTNESLEYPCYPVETLKNNGGDCEDLAILTASILNAMGYDVALLRLTNHMAVGVILDINISNYEHYKDNYYFLETTNNHKLGYIPEEYKSDSNLEVYPISYRPLLIHNWKNNSVFIFKKLDFDDLAKVTLFVENIGSSTALNILISAGFYTQNNQEINVETEIIPSLEPGMKKKVTITAEIPQDIKTWFKTRIYLDNNIVDEKESKFSFP